MYLGRPESIAEVSRIARDGDLDDCRIAYCDFLDALYAPENLSARTMYSVIHSGQRAARERELFHLYWESASGGERGDRRAACRA